MHPCFFLSCFCSIFPQMCSSPRRPSGAHIRAESTGTNAGTRFSDFKEQPPSPQDIWNYRRAAETSGAPGFPLRGGHKTPNLRLRALLIMEKRPHPRGPAARPPPPPPTPCRMAWEGSRPKAHGTRQPGEQPSQAHGSRPRPAAPGICPVFDLSRPPPPAPGPSPNASSNRTLRHCLLLLVSLPAPGPSSGPAAPGVCRFPDSASPRPQCSRPPSI